MCVRSCARTSKMRGAEKCVCACVLVEQERRRLQQEATTLALIRSNNPQ